MTPAPDPQAIEVNRDMIVLARQSRGLTQVELGVKSGVSQSKLSKFENGLLRVGADDLGRLAVALKYPPEFFALTDKVYGFGSACNYNRRRTSVGSKDLYRMLADLNVTRMRMTRLLRGVEIEAANEFFNADPDEYERDIERIAALTRAHWNLPMGPVANLIGAIESAGGMVFKVSFGTLKIDALSQWAPGSPPIIFVNSEIPADRARHSIAHELGHLVMHQHPYPDMEKEADRFAAEFLLPAREIESELSSLSMPKLADLKLRWRVAMQSLIYRARTLGKISEKEYSGWFRGFSQRGYRRNEPVTIPDESPSLVFEVVESVRQAGALSLEDLARLLHGSEEDIVERFLPRQGGLRIVRGN
jgi:Zn-dependent peptidase ImmA (M78 family)/DNA-binding XRE family transcriptional regulator